MAYQVELRKVKKGEYFRRKLNAKTTYIREHYNRKSFWGHAGFSCTDFWDIGREIILNASTIVWVDVDPYD
mgnify:FL=1|tara:strand:+ start:123 stop:335 length:213 start_codon:yes stop_codon:yes gene_type:complete